MFSFIVWTAKPEVLGSFGLDLGFDIRWYGILFSLGFVFGYNIIVHIFKTEGKPDKDPDALLFTMIAAVVIGARLGHCYFYEPEYFLTRPLEVLMVWKGGLASHGATVGILFAAWLYTRKRPGQSYLWLLDRVVITVALAGAFIRFGNYMNSEIVGKPADMPWSVVFVRPAVDAVQSVLDVQSKGSELYVIGSGKNISNETGSPRGQVNMEIAFGNNVSDTAVATALTQSILNYNWLLNNEDYMDNLDPASQLQVTSAIRGKQVVSQVTIAGVLRHPAQMYEAISTFCVFLLLGFLWLKQKRRTPEGSLLGLFITLVFGLRFLFEFLKENQVDFEDQLALNMGQWLSIPLIPIGIFLIIYAYAKRKSDDNKRAELNK